MEHFWEIKFFAEHPASKQLYASAIQNTFVSDYPTQGAGPNNFSIGLLGATYNRPVQYWPKALRQSKSNCLTFLALKKTALPD